MPKKLKKKKTRTVKIHPESLPVGMQQTSESPAAKAKWPPKKGKTFTPMETGQPDQDEVADIRNPRAVQSGRGPLNEEGEGDRQNDELAELEQVEPDLKLDK